MKTISSHLFRARANGARVIFVIAKGDAGRIALYESLIATDFMDKGFAVMVGLPHSLCNTRVRAELDLQMLPRFIVATSNTMQAYT